MKQRLVIDDMRVFRDVEGVDTVHALDAFDGVRVLYSQPWDEVWLDHDMGYNNPTGSELIAYIERTYLRGDGPEVGHWYVHTFNMVGAEVMMRTLKSLRQRVTRVQEVLPYLDTMRTPAMYM